MFRRRDCRSSIAVRAVWNHPLMSHSIVLKVESNLCFFSVVLCVRSEVLLWVHLKKLRRVGRVSARVEPGPTSAAYLTPPRRDTKHHFLLFTPSNLTCCEGPESLKSIRDESIMAEPFHLVSQFRFEPHGSFRLHTTPKSCHARYHYRTTTLDTS